MRSDQMVTLDKLANPSVGHAMTSGPHDETHEPALRNVADLVGAMLARLGVAKVFGVVGSGNLVVTNRLCGLGATYVAARHEAGAITMADAYVRTSGELAVATTHQGCGLTNALTGIGEAAKSRTPLIVLTADSAGSAVNSNFKIDQDALVRSVGAVSERVHSAQSAVTDVLRAYRAAVHGRRTVVLNLPLDVQSEEVPAGTVLPTSVPDPGPVRPNDDAVEELLSRLSEARRPVFIAGRGARTARDPLAALAEKFGALLATSAVANGLFEGETYNLGISGGFSSPTTADLIRHADLLIGWGSSLNMWTMRHGSLIGDGAVVVQVDSDIAALGAHRPVDLAVLGDVAETAAAVLGRANEEATREGYRTADVAAKIAAGSRWRDVAIDDLSSSERIDPRILSSRLDEILPKDRVIAVDSGNFVGYPVAYLAVQDQYASCFTQSFQSVGLGLFTALGAALAQPERLPVLGVGDGGFLMSISELETAVRLRIPLVVIVYNDNAYGAEVHHFADTGEDLSTVVFPDTDLASIARGYGAAGVTVRNAEDLQAVEEWLQGPRETPIVIDAKVADDGGAWWLEEAFRGH